MTEPLSTLPLEYSTPVDRAARDFLADALAAYMRREIDNFALNEAVFVPATGDQVVRSLGSALWFHYDDLKRHTVSASPEEWDFFRRVIAFLKTERMLPTRDLPQEQGTRRRWLGLAALVTVVAAFVLSYFASRWWLLLPGATIGLWQTVQSYRPASPGPATEAGHYRWYPFAKEAEWLAAAPLLETANIPPYDPTIHAQPIRRPGALSSLAVVPGVVLWTLAIAPLLTILDLLPRRRNAVAADA